MAIQATNGRYLRAIAAFEADDSAVRIRDRKGDCPECGGVGTVNGEEQRKATAVRVDGECSACDFEMSRAGYVSKEG